MRLRALIGSGLVMAFLLAMLLAAAPQWHEQVHGSSGEHECAASLLVTGTLHHAAPAIRPLPCLTSECQLLASSPPHYVRFSAFSLLEHAPPAAS